MPEEELFEKLKDSVNI
jgi:hypothetical protein